ncbi:MAG: hypothetical protein ACP5VS_17125, partial [Desulfomonilaceae bacterium]
MPNYCVSLINEKFYIKKVNNDKDAANMVKNQIFYDWKVRKALRIYIQARNRENARKNGERLLRDFMVSEWPKAKAIVSCVKQGTPVYLQLPAKCFSERATLHKITKAIDGEGFVRVWREVGGDRSHDIITNEDELLSIIVAHGSH